MADSESDAVPGGKFFWSKVKARASGLVLWLHYGRLIDIELSEALCSLIGYGSCLKCGHSLLSKDCCPDELLTLRHLMPAHQ